MAKKTLQTMEKTTNFTSEKNLNGGQRTNFKGQFLFEDDKPRPEYRMTEVVNEIGPSCL